MALSAPDKADAQMAAKIFDLVLSAMQKYSEDSFLQATGCAAIGVLAGPTPKDSDLGVARQAQLGKAFDRILAALQAPNGNRDVHQAACATLLELDLNHSYLMRINAADAAVCNISLAMSASEASDTDKNECKQLYDKVKAAEKKDAEIKAKHNSVLSQVSNVMSQAGKELKAAYALQIAIRCIPCLIATCTEASPGQSERILLLLEKVVLDASYRVAVERSVAKLFAQHRANPATFMDVCFKSLILPIVKAVSVKGEAPREDAKTSQLSPESLSKFLLAQMVFACSLDAKACVQYLAHPNHFKLICRLVVQQTGARRVALLQILARLIRLAELPQAFQLYFAPIMKKHTLRLDVDKIKIGREEGISDLALAGTLCLSHVCTVCACTRWAYGAQQGELCMLPASV
jgi:hypothetical protein